MKQALLILLLALAPAPAPVAAQTAPSGLSGTWEASMVDPNNSDPATWPIGLRGGVPTTLRFEVEGDTIKGVVTVDTWPGDCDITGSKLAGNRFSLSPLGRSPWRSSNSIGYPMLELAGTVAGDELRFTLTWDSFTTEMKGKRILE